MKPKTTLLTGIIVLAMGLILLISHDGITDSGIVTLGGIFFIVAAIIDIILYVTGKDKDGKPRKRGASMVFGIIVCIAAMVLGVSMLVFNETFTRMIAPLFGIIVAIGALTQLWILVYGTRPVRMPRWMYAIPAAMLVCAIIIFVCDFDNSTVNIITGSSLVLFGVTGFVESALLGIGLREIRRNAEKDNVIEIQAKDGDKA